MDSNPPRIGPAPGGHGRPTWSVMLPTYEPGPGHFEAALRSVLDQAPGPGAMQIAVVDDASPGGDAGAIARRLAPGRVEFHRHPSNVGLAGNWNACLRLARGHWVHILHQDDLVLPGFYERLGRADAAAPGVGAAFCRHSHIDADGRRTHLAEPERETPGVLDGWLRRIARMQRVQCPSIVVRRDVYEALGGYRADLCQALDWEMWVRIAANYPVWYDPEPLACFRLHNSSETARLSRLGRDVADVHRAVAIVRGYLPPGVRDEAGAELIPHFRRQLLEQAARLMEAGDHRGGLARVREACRHEPALRCSRVALHFHRWAWKLRLKSLRDRIRSARGPGLPDPLG